MFGDGEFENGGVAETFFVNLSSPVGGTILDGLGVGTIINDDRAKLMADFEPFGNAVALTADQLQPIAVQAAALWASQTHAILADIELAVADLPAGQLGEAFGNTITVDINANGAGWYIDPTHTRHSTYLGRGVLSGGTGRSADCRRT